LVKAVEERKAAICSKIDDQIRTLQIGLLEKQQQVTDDIEACTQLINTALQLLAKKPDMASYILQGLNDVTVKNAIIPLIKVVFSATLLVDISNEGKLVVGQVSTVAGSAQDGYKDDKNENALFHHPCGIVFNQKDGCCYIADSNNNRIRKVTPQGEVSTFAGTGEAGCVDGISTVAKFSSPVRIGCNNTSGDLYVTDLNNHTIRKISPTGIVSTFAGNGKADAVDGQALNAAFKYPWGIDIDQRDGTVYVADTSNHKIRKISPQGIVETLAGCGTAGKVNGTASLSQFKSPKAIAVHPGTGDIYVSDDTNHLIRKISEGVVSTVAGVAGVAGGIDGNCNIAQFNRPWDIRIDHKDGSLLVIEYTAKRLRKIHQGVVSTITWPEEDSICSSFPTHPTSLSIDQANGVCYVATEHAIMRVYLV